MDIDGILRMDSYYFGILLMCKYAHSQTHQITLPFKKTNLSRLLD